MATSTLYGIIFLTIIAALGECHTDDLPHHTKPQQKVHRCIHDQLDHKISKQYVSYNNHPFDAFKEETSDSTHRRKLVDDADYQLIRLSPYYTPSVSTTNGLTTDQVTTIKQIVSASIRYLESFVSVIPVSTPLYLNPCKYFSLKQDVDNDFLHYVCTASTLDYTCGTATIPSDHTPNIWVYDSTGASTLDQSGGGGGVTDSDLVIYVTYNEGTECTSTTIAYAGSCIVDQYSRPIAGYLNFCPSTFADLWKFNVMIALHEITHIMILSSGLMEKFYNVAEGRFYDMSEVVMDAATSGTNNDWIVTEKVKAVAQEHYDCDTVIGAPLENSGGEGTVGQHWEGKYLHSEYMIGAQYDSLQKVSKFTLALMEDSGWYKVDYNYAERYAWGKHAGCAFLNQDCITSAVSNFPQFWCENTGDDGCNYDFSASGVCFLNRGGNPPNEFKYYTDDRSGPESHDYCGFIEPVTTNEFAGVCWDTRGDTSSEVSSSIYAVDARCVDTLATDGTTKKGYCFKMNCIGYDTATSQYSGVDITVGVEVVRCLEEDALHSITVSTDGIKNIVCPNVDAVCGSSSEPFECYYGDYNDATSSCICSAGYIGATCNEEDNALHEEAMSGTPSPVKSVSYTSICFTGLTVTKWYNTGYDKTEEFDGIPAFYNSTLNVWLFFQRKSSSWYMGNGVDGHPGGTLFKGWCEQYVGPNSVPMIEECEQWQLFDGTQMVQEADARVYVKTGDVCDGGGNGGDGSAACNIKNCLQSLVVFVFCVVSMLL